MKRKQLSDQIRAAVDASGMSRYAICLGAALDQGTMSRFMAGTAGLSTPTMDKLADFLDLIVVKRPRPKRRSKRKEA
jgi:hypothetical protein